MEHEPIIFVSEDGTIRRVTDPACILTGLPRDELVGGRLQEHILEEHRLRFDSELGALVGGEEEHGRVKCAVIGLDRIGRRLTMQLARGEDADEVLVLLAADRGAAPAHELDSSTLSNPSRLLPVARRISGICRRSKSREQLLLAGLEVLVEITSAKCGAAIEWGGLETGWPITARRGDFDEQCLTGVFRPAVIGRLTRGDVMVKEADPDGGDASDSLILIPLMSSATPEGLVALQVSGYSVLLPIEQQSLGVLGEVMGLGLRALEVADQRERGDRRQAADVEASVALGRLSAGLAYEINNAATVLINNAEQMQPPGQGFGRAPLDLTAMRDSTAAVDTIRHLTEALRAFAPEQTREEEEVDLLRVVELVVASVRFHAKRGIRVTVERPDEELPLVRCRSHYLVRSLFLIFVELVEPALHGNRELGIALALSRVDDNVALSVTTISSSYSVPSVLLAQLERGAVLPRHVSRAGGSIEHQVDDHGLRLRISLPAVRDSKPQVVSTTPSSPPRRGTILVVEPELAVLRSTRRVLEQHHDVLAARNAEEAIRIVHSNKDLDVVLIDVALPGMAGPALYEEVKRIHEPLAERVIFVSGGLVELEVGSYLESVANPVIAKPIDPSSLTDLIATMIR
jgi:CheY-like chemotaxis protein